VKLEVYSTSPRYKVKLAVKGFR